MISIRTIVAVVASLTAACADVSADAAAQETDGTEAFVSAMRADSVYTDIDTKHCALVEQGEAYSISDCGGVGGYRFLLEEGDLRYSATIASSQGKSDLDLWSGSLDGWPQPKMAGGFQDVGPKVEWRVDARSRKPFALVFRILENAGADQFLVVAKVTPSSSCLFKIVDGRAPNANELARQAADLARTSACPAR
jgi:hypothetical protein